MCRSHSKNSHSLRISIYFSFLPSDPRPTVVGGPIYGSALPLVINPEEPEHGVLRHAVPNGQQTRVRLGVGLSDGEYTIRVLFLNCSNTFERLHERGSDVYKKC